jgi:hypothetical protein
VKFHLKEREVLIGATTGVTAFLLIKQGWVARVPALGPASGPIVAILAGIVLAGMVDGGGTGGDILEGVGYGLIAAGAVNL